MDVWCTMYQSKMTFRIENTLKFTQVSKLTIDISPTKLTLNGKLNLNLKSKKIMDWYTR